MASMEFAGRKLTDFCSIEQKAEKRGALLMNTGGLLGRWRTGRKSCSFCATTASCPRPGTQDQ